MDVTATPSWGFGLSPPKVSRPASFVETFPTTTTTNRPISTEEEQASGTMPQTDAWADILAARPNICRKPAWVRVPSVTRNKTIIMKQVGAPACSTFDLPEPKTRRSAVLDEEEDHPCSRRRLATYFAIDAEHEVGGEPETQAKMANLIMGAKAEVANACMRAGHVNMLSNIEHTFGPDKMLLGQTKRSLEAAFGCGADRGRGGNHFFRTYPKIVHIVARAHSRGQPQTDTITAAIDEMTSALRASRPDPRQRVVMYGQPELSDIKDVTEPESPTIMHPPTAGPQSSPTKRRSVLTTPIKNGFERFAAGVSRLVPGSSSKAGGSPAKSSPPAKSLSPDAAKRRSPFSQKASPSLPAAPEHQSPNAASDSPRVFQVPSSPFRSSTPFKDHSTREAASPEKYDRPLAPTPSRWNPVEQHLREVGSPAPATPRPGNELGLLAAMPATPAPIPGPDDASFSLGNPDRIDFGDSSALFVSLPDGMRAARRRSEPLARTVLQARKRREASSPQKKFKLERSRKSLPAPSLSPLSYERKIGKKAVRVITSTLDHDMSMDEAPASPRPLLEEDDVTGTDATLALTRQAFPGTLESYHKIGTPIARGVYSVDMHHNPDIFGNQGVASPAQSVTSANVTQLAQIAEDRCNGHAKVVVSQKNGKLVVRFKLPTKYADLFPQSQGRDESFFTTSPSISHSPRITFKGHSQLAGHADDTVNMQDHDESLFSSADSTAQNMTAQVADSSAPHATSKADDTTTQDCLDSLPSFPDFTALEHTPTHLAQTHASSSLAQTPPVKTITPSGSANSAMKHISSRPTQTSSTNPPAIQVPVEQALEYSPSYMAQMSPTENLSAIRMSVKSPLLPSSSPAYVDEASATLGFGHSPSANDSRAKRISAAYETSVFTRGDSMSGLVWREVDSALTLPALADSELSSGKVSSETPTPSRASKGKQPEKSAFGSRHSTRSSGFEVPDIQTQGSSSASKMTTSTPAAAPITQQAFSPIAEHAAGTPTLVTSFTPVNQSTPTGSPKDSPRGSPKDKQLEDANTSNLATHGTSATVKPTGQGRHHKHEGDSPEYGFIREFIRKNNPQQASTAETGSPIAQPARRQPLGAKSPNAASPLKTKRKIETDSQDQSPVKNATDHPAKKARRETRKPSGKKSEKDREDMGKRILVASTRAVATEVAETADSVEDDAEMDNSRRSSRLRTQNVPVAPRSSIPTPIKLGRSGGHSSTLNLGSRNEQQDVTNQTRSNTRKNKGNAEYPAQVLEKFSKTREGTSEQDGDDSSSDKAGRRVGWKSPLESHQEEKPKRGMGAGKGKVRVTLGNTGVAKPAKKLSTATLAQNLGMAGNGTPAKPKPARMTRSRARVEG